MIIANERDVTAAVLAEAARAPDARTREILQAGITPDKWVAFYCGTADSLLPGNQNLHKLLADLKIDHTYVEVDGANHSMTPLVAALKRTLVGKRR